MLRNVIRKNNNYLLERILANIKDWNCNLPKTGICYSTLLQIGHRHAYYNNAIVSTRYYDISSVNKTNIRYKTTSSFKTKEAKSTKEESSSDEPIKEINVKSLTRGEKLKKAVKEYGSTVIVFHIGISLISLGTCYLVVSSGLDITKVFEMLGLQEWLSKSETAASAGTFAVAYAVHKVFAPVRIAITLACAPLIVRYLRRIGFLKK